MVAAAAIRLGPGGVTALLQRTQSAPGTTPPAAAGMVPAARRARVGVWRRDPRDRGQGCHYCPPGARPRPQPVLEPRLSPPREGPGGRGGARGDGAGPRRRPGKAAGAGEGGPVISYGALRRELQMKGDPAPPGASQRGPGRGGRRGQPLTCVLPVFTVRHLVRSPLPGR